MAQPALAAPATGASGFARENTRARPAALVVRAILAWFERGSGAYSGPPGDPGIVVPPVLWPFM